MIPEVYVRNIVKKVSRYALHSGFLSLSDINQESRIIGEILIFSKSKSWYFLKNIEIWIFPLSNSISAVYTGCLGGGFESVHKRSISFAELSSNGTPTLTRLSNQNIKIFWQNLDILSQNLDQYQRDVRIQKVVHNVTLFWWIFSIEITDLNRDSWGLC